MYAMTELACMNVISLHCHAPFPLKMRKNKIRLRIALLMKIHSISTTTNKVTRRKEIDMKMSSTPMRCRNERTNPKEG